MVLWWQICSCGQQVWSHERATDMYRGLAAWTCHTHVGAHMDVPHTHRGLVAWRCHRHVGAWSHGRATDMLGPGCMDVPQTCWGPHGHATHRLGPTWTCHTHVEAWLHGRATHMLGPGHMDVPQTCWCLATWTCHAPQTCIRAWPHGCDTDMYRGLVAWICHRHV